MADPKMYTYIPDDPPDNIDALRLKWTRYLNGPSEPDLEHWWNWTVLLK